MGSQDSGGGGHRWFEEFKSKAMLRGQTTLRGRVGEYGGVGENGRSRSRPQALKPEPSQKLASREKVNKDLTDYKAPYW